MNSISKMMLGVLVATGTFCTTSSCKKEDKKDVSQPSEVSNFIAIGENGSVQLNWEKPTGDFTAYSLSYSPDGVPQTIEKGLTSFNVSNLSNGVSYVFTLKVKGENGSISSGVNASAMPSDESSGGSDSRYIGDVEFYSQADLNAFDAKYTMIEGKVVISGPNIDDLSPLSKIDTITDAFEIYFNDTLTSLSGLEGLRYVGDNIYIRGNDDLLNLDALLGLEAIGKDLSILDNSAITHLDGFSNVTHIAGDIYIGVEAWKTPPKERANNNLSDFCGLKKMLTNFNGDYYAEHNAQNPTVQDILTNCQ